MNRKQSTRAFSLVEVVLALAIVVFAGFALIGLLATGIQNNQDSKQRLQAATIAEAICSIRRAAPTNDLTTLQTNFPLPILTNSVNNLSSPLYLTRDGATNSSAANSSFGFLYNINGSTNSPGIATAYLCLYWPPQASPTNAAGHYEIGTSFALP